MSSYVKRENNQLYYLRGFCRQLIPRFVWRLWRLRCLRNWQQREDADYIRSRVDFYCRKPAGKDTSATFEARRLSLKKSGSRYYFDLQKYLRAFRGGKRLRFMTGDIRHNSSMPTLAKARRLDDLSTNMTLLKLDRRRHYYLEVNDEVLFRNKKPVLFFRGDIYDKPHRVEIFKRFFDSPLMNLGDTSSIPSEPGGTKWQTPFTPLTEHFNYQFILCPEGNDVSTAVQWVMLSNCIPVMTRPTVETWLMHSLMKPGVHYIEVADDYSDLEEKIAYYAMHQEEAEQIALNSQEWAQQFNDTQREDIISLLVLEKYFGE